MKTKFTTTLKTIILTATMLVNLNLLTTNAQVTQTTPNVKLFCNADALDLGAPPTNTEWRVLYSETQTTTPSGGPTLTGNTVAAADFKTGYYYIYTVGDASNPTICESDFTELIVYKFAELTVDFTAEDYCEEDVADQTFVGTATTAETTGLSYQWYTVSGGTETKIDGANTKDYKPVTAVTAGTITTYRLKAGYLVENSRYCSVVADHDVSVTAKPGQPTITVEGVTGEAL